VGRLTTHVLDVSRGAPARGVSVTLSRDGAEIVRVVTNGDGRCDEPLLEGAGMIEGVYELEFAIGDYYALPRPRFLDRVTVRFGVTDPAAHLHVPLLVTPWSYTTYRGS
jgi:5-hydroxyisourate hydrolase